MYGLFQGKEEVRKKKFAILVEGYFDLIALAQFGITNVAASLGTAFTDNQAKLLHRFTERIVINYDGDSAGLKAARRAIEHLLPQNFDVKVLVLPDGKDPDDFIRENGVEAYNESRGKATPFLRFALDASVTGRNLNNAKQKAEAIEEFLPLVSTISNNIQRRESFDQAMEYFHIDDAALKKELWNTLKRSSAGDAPYITQQLTRVARSVTTKTELDLLKLIVADSELCSLVLPKLEESDYENLSSGGVFTAVFEIHKAGKTVDQLNLLNYIGDDETAVDMAHELLTGSPIRDAEEPIDRVLREAEGCILKLRDMSIEGRIKELGRDLILAEQAGDGTQLAQITREVIELQKMRHSFMPIGANL